MSENRSRRENIHLGTHDEKYGNWMSAPVFYMVGGLLVLAVVLAVLFFTVFHITVPGVILQRPQPCCWRCFSGSPGSGGSTLSAGAA